MDEFFKYLVSLYPLADELKAALIGTAHRVACRKNRPLLSAGETCDWLAFIEKGMLKTCYDMPGGDERIVSFQRAGEITCAIKSFTTNLAAKVSIVAMEETIIRKIRKTELEAICEKKPVFNIHVRKVIEAQTSLLEDHYLLLTLPARERLAHLRSEQAWILKDKRIRQYMIADYLGVDHATMSRWNGMK